MPPERGHVTGASQEKQCTQCSEWKPYSGYHKHENGYIGLAAACKACRAETALQRRRKNTQPGYIIKADRIRVTEAGKEKLCTKCSKWKPFTGYHPKKTGYMGLCATCKTCDDECFAQRSAAHQARVLSSPHEGHLVCTKCTKSLPTSDFSKRRASPNGYVTHCKACRIEYLHAYQDTLEGRFLKLCNTAKTSNAKRISRGRVFAPVEASPSLMRKLYDHQQCKCIISFVEMSSAANSDWLMSLERLDESIGYIDGNMALIAGEFNTQRQLTTAKAQYAFNPLNQAWQSESDRVQAMEHLAVQLGRVAPGQYNLTTGGIPSKFLTSKLPICRVCGTQMPDGGFGTASRICRPCDSHAGSERARTVLGFVQRLLAGARSRTQLRNKIRKASEIVDLTVKQVLDMIWEQGCRCYISGLLMILHPASNWQASLERLDTSKGYTKDNVKIICLEFNSSVRICTREEAPAGTTQMTPAKFAHATKCYQAEMARISQTSQDHSIETD
jgi:hypothetical protein